MSAFEEVEEFVELVAEPEEAPFVLALDEVWSVESALW